LLLDTTLDNEKLSMANVMMFTQTVLAAGNDTTRALLAGMVATLAEHPKELKKLVADRTLVPSAIEEVLRWVTPARQFIRYVTADTELRGQALSQGDYVCLAYDAANRDPEVFEDPEVFDISKRRRLGQIAFGYGTHVCIGAPVVRMETPPLLERLLDRFSRWEIVGDQRRSMTTLRSGWVELPVAFYE
jgi:cytochrome P450